MSQPNKQTAPMKGAMQQASPAMISIITILPNAPRKSRQGSHLGCLPA
jgi:hypothetical protein